MLPSGIWTEEIFTYIKNNVSSYYSFLVEKSSFYIKKYDLVFAKYS